MFVPKLLEFIACPVCHAYPFEFENLKIIKDSIDSGRLICPNCSRDYNIINRVPIIPPDGFDKNRLNRTLEPLETTKNGILNWKRWIKKQKNSVYYYPDLNPKDFIHWQGKMHALGQKFMDIKGTVLDVGCGKPEESLKYINSNNFYYIGVDPFYIGETSLPFVQGVGENLPFRDKVFDNVMAIGTLDHSLTQELFIKEVCRVLKNGGNFYLMSLIWEDHFDISEDLFHFRHISRYDINKYFRLYNLRVIKEDQIDWKQTYRKMTIFHTRPKF